MVIFGQDSTEKSFLFNFDNFQLQKRRLPPKAKFLNHSGVADKGNNVLVVCGGLWQDMS